MRGLSRRPFARRSTALLALVVVGAVLAEFEPRVIVAMVAGAAVLGSRGRRAYVEQLAALRRLLKRNRPRRSPRPTPRWWTPSPGRAGSAA